MAGLGYLWKLRARISGDGVDIKTVMVAGAGANADIAVAGLKRSAQILGVIDLTTPADKGANVSLVKAGAFQLNATTAAKNLLVTYAQPR